jgi:hypothetical protein
MSRLPQLRDEVADLRRRLAELESRGFRASTEPRP